MFRLDVDLKVFVHRDAIDFRKWGIQLITVTPPAKDELARRYLKKLVPYGALVHLKRDG